LRAIISLLGLSCDTIATKNDAPTDLCYKEPFLFLSVFAVAIGPKSIVMEKCTFPHCAHVDQGEFVKETYYM
jgi:hypothetical protein